MIRISGSDASTVIILAAAFLAANKGAHAQLTVTTTDDAGAGSLRTAIEAANAAGGPQAIDFDLDFFVPQTIQLRSPLNIAGPALDLTIRGPGPDRLIVAGDRTDRILGFGFGPVFTVAPASRVAMSGFEVTRGSGDPGLDRGGGIDNNGFLTLSTMSISENAAGTVLGGGTGGGVRNTGTLVVTDSSITSNFAGSRGGGIYNEGELIISGTTLSSNVAVTDRDSTQGPAGQGGALYSSYLSGPVAVSDSAFINNFALLSGGAIETVGDTASMKVINSTISGNEARVQGGGISGNAEIFNSTISGNEVGGDSAEPPITRNSSGGGIAGDGVLISSIVAGNNAEANIYDLDFDGIPEVYEPFAEDIIGTFGIAENNLIGDAVGHNIITGVDGNIVGIDPLLELLADNGGNTLTYALLEGSPAIDAGSNPLGLAFDQRGAGFARVAGSSADIGAFELQAEPQVIPLPGSVWLFLSAFGGLGLLRFRDRLQIER